MNKKEVLNLLILDLCVDVPVFLEYREKTIVLKFGIGDKISFFLIGTINHKGVELRRSTL